MIETYLFRPHPQLRTPSTAAICDVRCTSTPAGELFEVNIVRRVELTGSTLLPEGPVVAHSHRSAFVRILTLTCRPHRSPG